MHGHCGVEVRGAESFSNPLGCDGFHRDFVVVGAYLLTEALFPVPVPVKCSRRSKGGSEEGLNDTLPPSKQFSNFRDAVAPSLYRCWEN